MTKQFVPHDQLTAGLWYLRTFVEPFYTVVSVSPMYDFQKMAPGELAVWLIDEEGNHELAAFNHDQFIAPVPPPEGIKSEFLGMFEGPMGVVNRYPSDLSEAFEQTRALIQEAKGADGPKGGFVTDHLDFAEHWLDKAETLVLSGKNSHMTFEQAWAEKEAAGYQYGADALEQVKFGWEIALAAMGGAE